MVKGDIRVEIGTLEEGAIFFIGNTRGQVLEDSALYAARFTKVGFYQSMAGEDTELLRVILFTDLGVPRITHYPETYEVTVRSSCASRVDKEVWYENGELPEDVIPLKLWTFPSDTTSIEAWLEVTVEHADGVQRPRARGRRGGSYAWCSFADRWMEAYVLRWRITLIDEIG